MEFKTKLWCLIPRSLKMKTLPCVLGVAMCMLGVAVMSDAKTKTLYLGIVGSCGSPLGRPRESSQRIDEVHVII